MRATRFSSVRRSRTPPPPGGGTSRSNPAPHSPAKTWSSGQHERKPLTEIMREEMCAEQSEKKRQQQNVSSARALSSLEVPAFVAHNFVASFQLETIELASQLKRNQLRDMYPNVPANLLDDIFLVSSVFFWGGGGLFFSCVCAKPLERVYQSGVNALLSRQKKNIHSKKMIEHSDSVGAEIRNRSQGRCTVNYVR